MPKFIIQELQDVASKRDGVEVEVKDLTAAKRAASRMQQFKGTILLIADSKGFALAVKEDGKWKAA